MHVRQARAKRRARVILKIRDAQDGCILPVRVHPGAKRDAITGIHDSTLKISLAAPAVDGRANDALVRFIAKHLGVRRVQVTVASGLTSRNKMLRIAAKSASDVLAALADSLD